MGSGVGIAGSPKAEQHFLSNRAPKTGPQTTSEIQKFRLPTDPNHFYIDPRPVPREGRCARHQRGAGCGGRWQRARRARPAGVRPSRVVLTPRCWRQVCEKKRRRRCQTSLVTGESAKEAVKLWRGECRVISGVTVVTNSYACFILHARLRVHWASGIPCALCFLRASGFERLGRIAPRDRGVATSNRHPEVRALRCTCTAGR